ncbi:uncharacterized protein [Magallana gigas]|uniref:uncharacterized protein isoform X1 n=1 Tax=Magallana gigas TaxID=29159 RepID=UPI0033421B19
MAASAEARSVYKRMKIWLIIFLALMVSHRVQSQSRLVVNTTCLELAKPSNKQLRLICSQYDYHCLLDETFTKEFEACREWKWIPEGKCAYFNTYGRGNIDERNCVPKNNLTCSHGTIQFSSATNTKYTACYVKKEISTSLPVTTSPTGTQSDGENATSVSTSSNKKYEMSGHPLPIILGIFVPLVSLIVIYFIFMHLKYVPLYRKVLKKILSGSAYPEENDIVMNEDTVEQEPFLRKETKDSSESPPTIKHEDENITGARKSTAYPEESDIVMNEDTVEQEPFLRNETKDSSESPPTIKHEVENITGARKSAYPEESDIVMNEDTVEQEPFLRNETKDSSESPPTIKHEDENITGARKSGFFVLLQPDSLSGGLLIRGTEDAYPEESGIVMNEDTVEQEPFLRNETKDSSESPPTIKHEDENITGARKSSNSDASDPADMNESDDLSEHFDDALSSPTNIKQKNSEVSTEKHQKGDYDGLRTIEVDSNTCKSADVDISKDLKEGVSTTEKSDNEERDTQELTDVFDDTVESLQRIAHPTDEQDVELCEKLYNLLDTEGWKLMQEVMAATITRETGKSVKTLIDQEKSKLKAMLPEESHRILESKTEHDTSSHVSYGLHRIILDEEKSPKSGWGNPVRETDTGIGDDVERLYRIHNIVQGIPCPVNVSVESYIRLLDIMIKALIRLDPGAEFKEDCKLLSYKLESIKNPKTQTMLGKIAEFVNIW